jgi:hypothetical protein
MQNSADRNLGTFSCWTLTKFVEDLPRKKTRCRMKILRNLRSSYNIQKMVSTVSSHEAQLSLVLSSTSAIRIKDPILRIQ